MFVADTENLWVANTGYLRNLVAFNIHIADFDLTGCSKQTKSN